MFLMPKYLLEMCRELDCKKIVININGNDEHADELDVYIDVENDDLCNTLYCWAADVFEGEFDEYVEFSFEYEYDLVGMEIHEKGMYAVSEEHEEYEDEMDDAYGGRWAGEAY